ncbi:hypothetical protein ANN_08767 [Periplaneta americana]|uniref:Uncharacterized protein n=1 Tax=Periplaneta americana TaxID=6978 RepID=A0ABQ8T2C9_PERAM|nr:hypothetical protein ANN_08767 [Periplaneta americana]
MCVECNRRLQALRVLGENIDNYVRILAPKILRAFPEYICRRWIIFAKREQLSEGHITRLKEFLNDEVESALTTKKLVVTHLLPTYFFRQQPLSTWEGDHLNIIKEQNDHRNNSAYSARAVDTGPRIATRICSRRGRASCRKCKKSHHYSICTTQDLTPTTVNQVATRSPDFTHLQTARVRVVGPTGLSKITRCVLDSGKEGRRVVLLPKKAHSFLDDNRTNAEKRLQVLIRNFEKNTTYKAMYHDQMLN